MDDALDGSGAAHWPAAHSRPGITHNNMRTAKKLAASPRPNRIRILRIQCNAGKKQAEPAKRKVRRPRPAKSPPKLKTPETEASGVSILITRSTVGVASSGYPSGRPPAFAGAATSGCAGFQNSDLRRRPALQLDRWPTFRLGSVSCLRLDRLQTSDSHRLFRTSARPSAIHQACA